MKRHVHAFTKGMDRDTSPYKFNQESYYELRNMRPITRDGLSTGDLESILGNLESQNFGATHVYVHHCILRDWVVFFLRLTNINQDFITKVPIAILLNTGSISSGLTGFTNVAIGQFNLYNSETSTPNPVTVVANYETELLNKLYFSTPDSEIMVVDLNENITGATVDDIKIVQDVTLLEPDIISTTAGNLPTGRVQYAYQLYKSFGSETAISPTSWLFNLTSTAYNSVSSRNLRGSAAETNSGKGLIIEFNNLDNNRFDRIRIYRILYEQINTIPKIDIIAEENLEETEFTFTDVGAAGLDTIMLEEFRELFMRFTPKHLVAKNNYLFAANYEKKNLLSIGEFDTRTYRYNINGNAYTGLSNIYNDLSEDPDRTDADKYIYKDDAASVIGGSGTNISYEIKLRPYQVDRRIDNPLSSAGTDGENYMNFASPFVAGQETPYQYDEIYRFGIVFYKNGIPSFANWIEDIRMPEYPSEGNEISFIKSEYVIREQTLESNQYDNVPDFDTLPIIADTVIQMYLGGQIIDEIIFNVDDIGARYESGSLGMWIISDGVVYDYLCQYFSQNIDFYNSREITFTVNDNNKTIDFSCKENNVATGTFYINVQFAFGSPSDPHISVDPETPEEVHYPEELIEHDGTFLYVDPSNDRIYALMPYVEFEVHDLPSEYDSWQIVRAKRDLFNRTVIDTGIIGYMYTDHESRKVFAGADHPHNGPYTPFLRNQFASQHSSLATTVLNADTSRVHYMSPEISTFFSESYRQFDRYDVLAEIVTDGVVNNSPSYVQRVAMEKGFIYGKLDNIQYKNVDDSILFEGTQDHTISQILGTAVIRNTVHQRRRDTESSHTETPGTKGRCLISLLSDPLTVSGSGARLARRRRIAYPYGGISDSALRNTEYYPCSNTKIGTGTQDVFGGDIYVGYFDFLGVMWSDLNGGNSCTMLNLPLESVINSEYRSYGINKITPSPTRTGQLNFVREEPGAYERIIAEGDVDENELAFSGLTQPLAYYAYNSAYSQENTIKIFFPEPVDINKALVRDMTIIHTDKKMNGEVSDSWTKFRIGHKLDLDATYGPITAFIELKEGAVAFQEDAINIIPIEPQQTIPSESSIGGLIIGSGPAMSRYNLITTDYGVTNKHHVVTSPTAIYFFDSKRKKILTLGENVTPISDLGNIRSLIDTLPNDVEFLGCYDSQYGEVLFTFKHGSITDFTIVFNEFTRAFTAFYDFYPVRYIKLPSGYGTMHTNNRFFVHNVGEYANFYGTKHNLMLKIISNPNNGVLNRFDMVEWITDYNNGIGPQHTFTGLSWSNSYQNSSYIGSFTTRLNTYIYNNLRDTTSRRFQDRYGIFTFTMAHATHAGLRFRIRDIKTQYLPIPH